MFKKHLKLLIVLGTLQSSLCMAQLILPQLFSGNGGVLNTNSAGVPSITATPTLGVGSTTTGKITFQNSTNNNTLTFQPGASANNLTWTLPTTDSTGTQCLSSNGSGTLSWSACGGGAGAALSGITAAMGANTIASGNNTGQVWNWANTTDSTVAFTFGESSAATNGTSTSGVPNQVLGKFSTLAASTQSPLSVYSRGSNVFSVGPSTTQIFATNGAVGTPTYSFASHPSGGMFATSSTVRFTANGVQFMSLGFNGSGGGNSILILEGTALDPALIGASNTNSGIYFGNRIVGISANTLTNSIFTTDGSNNQQWQPNNANANTTAYAVNFRKSRGTVLSPTVITTGDDLGTINFAGYVGGTNTFLNAAAIRATSTGTISDATNGIGGQVDIQTQKQGVDTSPQGRVRVDQLGHIASIAGTANTPTIGACGTSPSLSGTDNAALITVGTGGSATSCAMNFGSTWATNAPVCIAQNDTDKVAYSISATTSAVTISAAAAITASSKFHVICFGRL